MRILKKKVFDLDKLNLQVQDGLLRIIVLSKEKEKRVQYNKFLTELYKIKKITADDYNYAIDSIIKIKFLKSNIMIILTNIEGDVETKLSSGLFGFKGSEKMSKYAILNIIKFLFFKIKNFKKRRTISVHFMGMKKSFGKNVIKYLKSFVTVRVIKIFNKIPHNGCRPKKKRRL